MHISINDEIKDHFRLTAIQKVALVKLHLKTIRDLLYHFPVRYGDIAEAKTIDSLSKGESAVIFGTIKGLDASKSFKSKMTMATGVVEDQTGSISCVWFNQPYLAKMYTDGMIVRIEGKVSERRDGKTLYFSNPKLEQVSQIPDSIGDSLFSPSMESTNGNTHTLYPVYPESRGITSSWLYHTIQKIFRSGLLDKIIDPIPTEILSKYNLPEIKTGLIWIHTPLKRDDAISARKRFSFEEIFVIQLGKQKARSEYEANRSWSIGDDTKGVQEFIKRFPFQPTSAQTQAINNIISDMSKDKPMARLLEGDVGSGKTAVAAATAYAIVSWRPQPPRKNAKPKETDVPLSTRLQVAYMCPTEILAAQHFESFIQYFAYLGVSVGLITSSGCRKFPSKVNPKGWTDISRSQLLAWVENGIIIGTHSLIQKSVKFKHLALVIIDEQHRFGTAQRAQLVKKNIDHGAVPHLLSMTATPIPRTLALTMYGDLDLTVLDESPVGRKPVITDIVLPDNRTQTYEKVRLELQSGRQAYVICPRIDEPDPEKEMALNAKSVKEEAARLQKEVFPEYNIGILHGRMRPAEKDEIMNQFKNGEIHILCSTSVVEVGVNVPNATVIIIEGAERFGLSQLHQLRGRVIRSSHQAYAYLFTATNSGKSKERLEAIKVAKNGFELSELDLSQRGAGQLGGNKQWGISDIAMEALKNLKMVEAARTEASAMIEKDPSIGAYPDLRQRVEENKQESHFE